MILVFGQTGQVARELATLAPGARFLGRAEADLSDPAACGAAILALKPQAVINAAAWTAVDKAEGDEASARVVNADAPGAMARACAALGVPFVHLSTDYVFDGTGSRPWTPADSPAPLNAYGRTKLAGEAAVAASGASFVMFRTSWVFSPHGANFVKTMRRLGAERPALRVVADQTGGPTPARAIAAACLRAVEALRDDPGLGGLYHLAGAPDTTWADFARAILTGSELPARVEDIATADYPTPARRPLNSRLDCADLARLGLSRPDWRPALAEVLRELA
jgi:dTDP-4-dehydrorhamnose reductase